MDRFWIIPLFVVLFLVTGCGLSIHQTATPEQISTTAHYTTPTATSNTNIETTEVPIPDLLAQISQLVDTSVVPSHDPDVEVLSITYLSDGLEVKGYLALPVEGENLPCVIYNRGGNREAGALSDPQAVRVLGKIASWGYIVAASQYRGNAGGEGKEEFGGADVNDVLNLIPLLESLPGADPARIGMFGWSRGGMMTYISLARTDRIAAAIVGAGIAELLDGIERRPAMEKNVYMELIPDISTTRKKSWLRDLLFAGRRNFPRIRQFYCYMAVQT